MGTWAGTIIQARESVQEEHGDSFGSNMRDEEENTQISIPAQPTT
jgi:hypothetical protein